MTAPRILVIVALGAALGTLARVAMADAVPLGTLWANASGSLLIGIWAAGPWRIRAGWSRFVMDGFCGGFTTFSLLSLETLQFAFPGQAWTAAAYASGTVLLALACVTIGWHLGQLAGRPRRR